MFRCGFFLAITTVLLSFGVQAQQPTQPYQKKKEETVPGNYLFVRIDLGKVYQPLPANPGGVGPGVLASSGRPSSPSTQARTPPSGSGITMGFRR